MVWSDGKCMSNKNNSLVRCKCRSILKQDFCKNHMKTHQYCDEIIKQKIDELSNATNNVCVNQCIDIFIEHFKTRVKQQTKELDDKYMYCLLNIRSNWDEVPVYYRINLGGCWWDIRSLLRMFANDINQSEYSNPYPKCPENPFTRKRFTSHEIQQCFRHISMLRKCDIEININNAVEVFISSTVHRLNKIINLKDPYEVTQFICDDLIKTLRYKIINDQNSQGVRGGYWVKKTEKMTEFEKKYQEYLSCFNIAYNITNRQRTRIQLLQQYIQNAEVEEFPF